MFQAYGLYGHIQANRIRSVILLAGFVVLLHALLFSILLIWSAFSGGTLDEIVAGAAVAVRPLVADRHDRGARSGSSSPTSPTRR